MGICPKVGRQDELGPVQEVVVLEIRNKADVEAEEERWRQTLAQTVKGMRCGPSSKGALWSWESQDGHV